MKSLISLLVVFIHFSGCAQNKASEKQLKVGGHCEGCEAIYESPVSFKDLTSNVTLPDYDKPGPKLIISGIVYKKDGKTPAPNVVLYVYHTDQTGEYPKKGNETGWGRRHGYLRGWMKTNDKGEYQFFTLKPASYPGRTEPAHIHITIKEPDKSEYYIDDFLFDDDPLLTQHVRNMLRERGGSGILKTEHRNGILYAKRDLVLGKNVDDYP